MALSGVSHLLFVGCVLFTLDRVLSFLWDSMSNGNPHLLQKTREMGTPHSRSKARAALIWTRVLHGFEGMADELGVAAEFGD